MKAASGSPDNEELPDIRRKDLVLPLSCGSCTFYSRLAVFKQPCSDLGTPASAKTCFRFVPDPHQLDEPKRLFRVLSAIGKAKRPLLAASVVLGAKRVAKFGLRIGQIVYFRPAGDDYLNNYAAASIVGATKDRIVLAGEQGFTAFVYPTSVMTKEAFETKRKSLVKRDKVNDPSGGFKKLKVGNVEKLMAYLPELARASTKKRRGRPPGKRKKGPIILNPEV
jgi:hypothetical protein